jgi:hypothetical protein
VQTKAACWDGEFGRPEVANTFCDGELYDYAHSLVHTLDFELGAHRLEHLRMLLLNLGRTHEGTFQSGGASSVAMVTEAVHYTMAVPSRLTTPQSALLARDSEPSAPRQPHAGQQELLARS